MTVHTNITLNARVGLPHTLFKHRNVFDHKTFHCLQHVLDLEKRISILELFTKNTIGLIGKGKDPDGEPYTSGKWLVRQSYLRSGGALMSLSKDVQLSGAGHTARESSSAFIQHQLHHTTTTIRTHTTHCLLALVHTESAEETSSSYQSRLECTDMRHRDKGQARQQGGMILRWRDIISADDGSLSMSRFSYLPL